jgi:Tfp pilus assembly pilus retraction ATPase PilT
MRLTKNALLAEGISIMSSAPVAAIQVSHSSLVDLPFTELYVRVDDPMVLSRYKPDVMRTQTGSLIQPNIAVEAAFDHSIQGVREKLQEITNEYGVIIHDDMRLRYTISVAVDDEIWAALRPIPLLVPSPEELRLDPQFIAKMMEIGRRKGLVLIGGKTGQGKTTTAMAFLRNYLLANGGTLFTIEDPVEYMMSGAVADNAWCIQHDISSETEWKKMADKAKRFNPDYLLFGEIRTKESAEQLVSAANRGNLVVATIHSGSAADTVSSLLQLVDPAIMASARQIIGNRLVASIHQSMTAKGPHVDAVFPTFEANDVSRASIMEGKISQLMQSAKKFPPR